MQMQGVQKASSARTLAWLMTVGRDHLTKADTMTVAAVQAGVPQLAQARTLVERFAQDVAAIRVAVTEPWSNGQTEGQITRLKLVKRQM